MSLSQCTNYRWRTAASGQKRLTVQRSFVSFPQQQTPEALGALQKAQIEKWWPIIKEFGIKGE